MTSASICASLTLASILAAGASGCTAGGAGSTDADDGMETETDEAALAAMRYYDCRGSASDDTLSRIEIGLSATKIAVTDLSKDAVVPDTGKLDRGYRPGPQYTGAVRFQGFDKLEDGLSSDVAHVEVIASKELVAKAAQGKMWIRTSGSGGGSMSFWCKSKPSKLTVDVATKARLACSFSPIICTEDNPPGSTCLADLFVNQTANGTGGSATLRLSYLDHFGVRATPRNQSVGASSSLSRTKTTVEGAWADNELKLTYRGGVTYTGSFALPDGRSSKVQCNDLAMFD